ncbi:uncharacterized protein B0I36DRAFT_435996 [Microdochium trichocladiopsis]|uniref:Uncharacterized protein n=1 Tax=Microdochium trichocladiopsis TaxID=1682393 RepID=A0A9P8XV53_9PEZI|nr:uncharacterized protein B0I36DRAFT_435996 [Microdochium trichocladiopsis]KAH7016227.1 hypothetical protein B0I36DRAFT_435996 [Microdochium trichocladiopsis]
MGMTETGEMRQLLGLVLVVLLAGGGLFGDNGCGLLLHADGVFLRLPQGHKPHLLCGPWNGWAGAQSLNGHTPDKTSPRPVEAWSSDWMCCDGRRQDRAIHLSASRPREQPGFAARKYPLRTKTLSTNSPVRAKDGPAQWGIPLESSAGTYSSP